MCHVALHLPFNDVSSVDVFITTPIVSSVEAWDRLQQHGIDQRKNGYALRAAQRGVPGVGFSADKTCENEAMMMELDACLVMDRCRSWQSLAKIRP